MSIPCHDGSLFTWDGNNGVTEASTLNGPLDLDGCMVVQSHRTGRKVTFFRSGVDRDRENEVRAWHYATTEGDFTLTVFNT